MTAPSTVDESRDGPATDGDPWPVDAYDRPDGVGVRDRLLVLPSVICSHQVADRIADAVDGAVSASHDHGCSQLGADETQTERSLRGVANNPNVAGAVVVGLGCEGVQSDALAATLADDGVPVRELSIQGVGGSAEAVERGVDHARALIDRGSRTATAGLGDLTVGVVSGDLRDSTVERADPLVGSLVDRVVEAGGRVVVAGTERLRPHADAVEGTDRLGAVLGGGDAPRTAGPARRAAERSVEEVTRAWGGRPIRELVPYGAPATHDSGVALVDAPAQFAEAATGLAAAGAHVVVHATADGVPTGHPIVPVCKVTGDGETYAALEGDIDVDARAASAADLASTVGRVAGGERTCAERHGLTTFAITRVGPSM
ncbi:UxaA family hydrolase [Haloplanus salilacus]|uniref:UxaA family hydrolase n=1 Tax=Haloplanus salilacus TaxID=2949994 RepID=UPI0030D42D13